VDIDLGALHIVITGDAARTTDEPIAAQVRGHLGTLARLTQACLLQLVPSHQILVERADSATN